MGGNASVATREYWSQVIDAFFAQLALCFSFSLSALAQDLWPSLISRH
jgi:hypothetical protein